MGTCNLEQSLHSVWYSCKFTPSSATVLHVTTWKSTVHSCSKLTRNHHTPCTLRIYLPRLDQRHEVRDKVVFCLLPRLLPGRRCAASCGDGGGDGSGVGRVDSVCDGEGARVGHIGGPALSATVHIGAPGPHEIAEALDEDPVAVRQETPVGGSCVAAKLRNVVSVVRHAMASVVDGRREEGGAHKYSHDGNYHVQGQEAGG